MTATAPSALTRSSPNEGRAHLALLVVTAAAILATVGLTWWCTRLGSDVSTTLVAIAVPGAGAVVVALVGRRSGRSARWGAVAATLVTGAAMLVLATSGTLLAVKTHAHLAGWTAEAEAALAELAPEPANQHQCDAFPTGGPDLAAFGRVDQRCVSRGPRYRYVTFSQKDPMGGWTGLLYSPDQSTPDVMSQCLAHLDGPWWQTASAVPNCPSNRYTFVGGG